MKFEYFRDPDNFAYKIDEPIECSICHKVGLWFDAGGFYGVNKIECICDECLLAGKLIDLGIETNEAYQGSDEDREIINYKTPALPTWQDREWLFVNDEGCIFECVASKADYDSKDEFVASFLPEDSDNTDFDWLWDMLTDKKIANHKAGNFNVSVYLFTLNGKKYSTWDAS